MGASTKLDGKIHKNRKNKLMKHYKDSVMNFDPIDIVLKYDDDYVIYKNCVIVDVDVDYNNDKGKSILFKSENNNLIKWDFIIHYIKSYTPEYNVNGFYLTSRKDVVRFFKHIKSIYHENDIDEDGLDRVDINDFYISNTDMEFIHEEDYTENTKNKSKLSKFVDYFYK